MKPLPTVPLTDEDWAILVNHRGDFRRGYLMGWLLGHGRESDRRDAALMWRLQRNLIEFKAMRDYLYLIGEWVPCAAHAVLIGADVKGVDPGTAFNIPSCA